MTIQQLAKQNVEYFRNKELNEAQKLCVDLFEKEFINGALTVLLEIEECLERAKYYSDSSISTILYKDLVDTIKELRNK